MTTVAASAMALTLDVDVVPAHLKRQAVQKRSQSVFA
jgi:hypothetical protein